MLKKATWQHLRIPFSIFLMPVFCFAFSLSGTTLEWWRVAVAFISIHFFLYPASNGYNSYFDKDEESIGGLEKPPPVDKELYWAALVFDGISLLLGLLLGWQFALALLIYGLISKAYSYDGIRLKKYPIVSWLTVGVFQGAFTLVMSYMAIQDVGIMEMTDAKVGWAALLSTIMLLGSYPMTQVYQHEEDAKRGDETISLKLGIKGTFLFTAIVFGLSSGGFVYYYLHYFNLLFALSFLLLLSPVLVYFLAWMLRVWKKEQEANFRSTMRLNMISSVCLSTFYLLTWLFQYFEITL